MSATAASLVGKTLFMDLAAFGPSCIGEGNAGRCHFVYARGGVGYLLSPSEQNLPYAVFPWRHFGCRVKMRNPELHMRSPSKTWQCWTNLGRACLCQCVPRSVVYTSLSCPLSSTKTKPLS